MDGGEMRAQAGRRWRSAGFRAARGSVHALGAATAGLRVLPDFLIVGAMRGGTTTLYHYLVRHPRVAGAVLDKEVHYFDLRHERSLAWYRGRFPTAATLDLRTRRAAGPILVGEATPYYLFHPSVPARVASDLPATRVIALLRDPVERAWSHHRHEVELGYETLPFDQAIDREEERLRGEEERLVADPTYVSFAHQHHSYLARGRYAEQLERWFAHVPRDRCWIWPSEAFFADPATAFADLCGFLGLPDRSPRRWRSINASGDAVGLDPALRRRLRASFRSHDDRLEELLGRDMGWR